MVEMLMRRSRLLSGFGVMLGCALTGCQTGPQNSANAPRVTLVPDNRVILDPAMVVINDGSIEISGGVRRQPTLSGPMSGRVDIEFLSPEGELLDELPALLIPHDVTAGQSSTYHTAPYAYLPPKGSTLRIHFVDSDTESREDIEGTFFDYGGGGAAEGGPRGEQVAGVHGEHGEHGGANNHYAGHGGYGSGFGNISFSPNGGRH